MAPAQEATIQNGEVHQKKWRKRPWSDAEFLRRLRQGRERRALSGQCESGRMEHFFATPVNLNTDLPLLAYETKFSYPSYRVEQLQDVCNKATCIYSTDHNTWGCPLFEYILGIWSHGDIHTTDVEFGRFFAKFIETSRSDDQRPTTQDVLKPHKTVLDAAEASRAKGFPKVDHAEAGSYWVHNVSYKANYQIESFEQQLVCLIRTGWTAGLSQPVSFQGLEVQQVLAKDEVVVLLPEAIRFIMDLDEKEESLQEQRDPTVLETWLGDPEDEIAIMEKAVKASEPIWTAGFWPTGPSTEWWEFAKTLE